MEKPRLKIFTLSLILIATLSLGLFSGYELRGIPTDKLLSENMELKASLEASEEEKDLLLSSLMNEKVQKEVLALENERLDGVLKENTQEILTLKEKNELTVISGLVDVLDIDASIVVDLRYATENNFTKKKVYPDESRAILRLETALKLKAANEIFEKDGYHIKIWDGYRPKSVQEIFWALVPDPQYVADPSVGSNHNRGSAVDITLVDAEGNELEMPTDFDDFTEKASTGYAGNSPEAQKNMEYLIRVMNSCGFVGNRYEWWHWNDSTGTYPLNNVSFDQFAD